MSQGGLLLIFIHSVMSAGRGGSHQGANQLDSLGIKHLVCVCITRREVAIFLNVAAELSNDFCQCYIASLQSISG